MKFLTAIIVIFLFTSCELFLAPKQPRDNPNDPDNPVQPAEDFQAVGVSSTEVSLTFVVPSPEDTSKIPAGYVIARSIDGPPGWVDQGTLVSSNPVAGFEGPA